MPKLIVQRRSLAHFIDFISLKFLKAPASSGLVKRDCAFIDFRGLEAVKAFTCIGVFGDLKQVTDFFVSRSVILPLVYAFDVFFSFIDNLTTVHSCIVFQS